MSTDVMAQLCVYHSLITLNEISGTASEYVYFNSSSRTRRIELISELRESRDELTLAGSLWR
jgi:hypothetical protein